MRNYRDEMDDYIVRELKSYKDELDAFLAEPNTPENANEIKYLEGQVQKLKQWLTWLRGYPDRPDHEVIKTIPLPQHKATAPVKTSPEFIAYLTAIDAKKLVKCADCGEVSETPAWSFEDNKPMCVACYNKKYTDVH